MKKSRISLITAFILLILTVLVNASYAATGDKMNMNITDVRPYTNSRFTIVIGEGGTQTDAKIFKIFKDGVYSQADKFALYCLRGGKGFGNIDLTGTPNMVEYTEFGNFKQDAQSIINYYQSTIGYNNIDTDSSYNAILWIADNAYLPENQDMDMLDYLAKAGITGQVYITADEIEVVQQMALWYFANYDTNGQGYSFSLPTTAVLTNLLKKDGESYHDSVVHIDQIDKLYTYLINSAKANAAKYGNGNTRDVNQNLQRVKIDKTQPLTITLNQKGDFYVIGPINIQKTNQTDDYKLEVKLLDAKGEEIPVKNEGGIPILFDMDGFELDSLEGLVGTEGEPSKNAYIQLWETFSDQYDLSKVKIETTTTYFKTTSTLWVAGQEDQPVIKIEKEKVVEKDEITTDILQGLFKLKIRKTDGNNNLLPGAGFTIINESDGRAQLVIKDNGDGTFETVDITIKSDGESFIFSIEETKVPGGYIGLDNPFKIKITTKKSADGTKYVVDKVEFIDSTGATVNVPGVSYNIADGEITITVQNSKSKDFDLALRKYITKINGTPLTGADDRTPKIDTSFLNEMDATTGKMITTAKYTHSKTPIVVKHGDIVTYKLRVYNEGELDGYATQISDYLPEGLGYLMDYTANTNNLWHPVIDETNKTINLIGEDGLYKKESEVKNLAAGDFDEATVKSLSDVKILAGKAQIYSSALADDKIKAYDPNTVAADINQADQWQQSTNGTDGLYYREIEVTCIVLAENSYEGVLRNIAEIKEDKALDENGNVINANDRDSTPDDVNINAYNPPSDNSSYQQDDDDYEPLILKHFDLALRKFITGVNNSAITSRIPQPKLVDGKIKYEHDKTPVDVVNGDLVTYTIRVYNEGTILGYAIEVSDDIPDGVVFLPNDETNKEYGWKMYDAQGNETDDPTKAVEVRTKYLENTLLNPFDSSKAISTEKPYNPDCADVKVVFQVVEQNITSPDRIITNKAQITEDKAVDENGNELDIDDDDSIPNEWIEEDDDQDVEHIKVKYFDLALLKWVTKTIVTVDGTTTTTDTGFTPYDDPEPIAKVVIDKKKINQTVVKFVFSIRITNEGEIAGYATEITDYIPAGLQFVPEDNPLWTLKGDGKVATRQLEGKLLQPGDHTDVEIIFTWINGEDNVGLKTNIAEISEDYNDSNTPDIDSKPDDVITDNYDKQQQDDDDKALVMLELKLGGEDPSYTWLVLVVLTILAGGIILIKKVVLI